MFTDSFAPGSEIDNVPGTISFVSRYRTEALTADGCNIGDTCHWIENTEYHWENPAAINHSLHDVDIM